MVLPLIHYGSAIWRYSQFTCINAVHNKACLYVLGVGKYTPNAAVHGETGIFLPIVDEWIKINRNWRKMLNTASQNISSDQRIISNNKLSKNDASVSVAQWWSGDLHPGVRRFESHQHRPSLGVDIGFVLFSKRCKK